MMKCLFYRKYKTPDGKKKCRCQYDGSIRNRCKKECPHYRKRALQALLSVWRHRYD